MFGFGVGEIVPGWVNIMFGVFLFMYIVGLIDIGQL
jgi:hypothetical protein